MTNFSISSVFSSLVEVAPMPECEIVSFAEIAGAFVRCCFCAETEENASKLIHDALESLHFKIVNIEWCVDESKIEWEFPDDPIGRELVSEARLTKEVVLGEFHTWPHE